ncbi:MAG: DUF924 family protein, partial [Sphingopyxis sp.]|nr:DUF924 family protein [Sphingopyxis sp.]
MGMEGRGAVAVWLPSGPRSRPGHGQWRMLQARFVEGHGMATTADEVLRFWREAGMQAWFNGGEAFDRQCETRFLDAHLLAARRGCEDWMASA